MGVKRVGTHRLLYYLLAKYRKPTNLNNYCAGMEKGKVWRRKGRFVGEMS